MAIFDHLEQLVGLLAWRHLVFGVSVVNVNAVIVTTGRQVGSIGRVFENFAPLLRICEVLDKNLEV